ncbi:universal stress protein PHOS32-like [Coffea eugenioides]|uniref:universal stress protein PHOS32-like n=1 Tax=Coffea eugenioides TaxID=49369 RepID=UPI000F60844D|nr:universal stress protein PHOS32-like [Coffea eugenioides]
MNSQQENDHRHPNHLPPVQVKPPPTSPAFSITFSTPTSVSPLTPTHRRIAIAVDLSDESAFAVKWAIENYLRPGDAVILLHVRPTSILYGADWGSNTPTSTVTPPSSPFQAHATSHDQKLEEDFDNLTNSKATGLSQPLVEAQVPFKIHIVKDHDLKERLCLEVERLGLSAVIMGSRGFGASRKNSKGRLGSVSDYCVHHCVCPVVVVRYPGDNNEGRNGGVEVVKKTAAVINEAELHPLPEEENETNEEVISAEKRDSEGMKPGM